MTERIIKPDYEIINDTDISTVWINGPSNCLGRFAPLGYEVYRTFNPHDEIGNDTLRCRIGNMNPQDWDEFVELMRDYHSVELEEIENPIF